MKISDLLRKMAIEDVEIFGDEIVPKAIEELCELMQVLCKYLVGDKRYRSIAEETADVYIILEGLRAKLETENRSFRPDFIASVNYKVQRQVKRIYEKKRENSQ